MKKLKILSFTIFIFLFFGIGAGCKAPFQNNNISVFFTPSETEHFENITMTIDRLEVHRVSDQKWMPINMDPVQIDFNNSREKATLLTSSNFPVGQYDKFRFFVRDAEMVTNERTYMLECPKACKDGGLESQNHTFEQTKKGNTFTLYFNIDESIREWGLGIDPDQWRYSFDPPTIITLHGRVTLPTSGSGLAGVDTDGDGLRDDVATLIESLVADERARNALRAYARALQAETLAGTSTQWVGPPTQTLGCVAEAIPDDWAKFSSPITRRSLNTSSRQKAHSETPRGPAVEKIPGLCEYIFETGRYE
jgi:hypothetical protein